VETVVAACGDRITRVLAPLPVSVILAGRVAPAVYAHNVDEHPVKLAVEYWAGNELVEERVVEIEPRGIAIVDMVDGVDRVVVRLASDTEGGRVYVEVLG